MRNLIPILLVGAVAAAEPAGLLTLAASGKVLATAPLPAGWSVAVAGEKVTIIPSQKRPHIQVWPVAAMTPAAAEAAIATLVASEVKDFTPNRRGDVTVAGRPARQLSGSGIEADDGDPGNAEVTIFAVGPQVFLLVSHGEGGGVGERHDELLAIMTGVAPH